MVLQNFQFVRLVVCELIYCDFSVIVPRQENVLGLGVDRRDRVEVFQIQIEASHRSDHNQFICACIADALLGFFQVDELFKAYA